MIVTRREMLEGAIASPIAAHAPAAWSDTQQNDQPSSAAPTAVAARNGAVVVDAAVAVSAAWPILLASLATGPAATVRDALKAIDSDAAAASCAAGPALAGIIRVKTLLDKHALNADLKVVAMMPASLSGEDYVLVAKADTIQTPELREQLEIVVTAIETGVALARGHRRALVRIVTDDPGRLPPRLCKAVLSGRLQPEKPTAVGWTAACARACHGALLRSDADNAFAPLNLPLKLRVAVLLAKPDGGRSSHF